ncbi:MAG: hypothetical protein AAF526_06550, partial [Pseudomonadota bacterium]
MTSLPLPVRICAVALIPLFFVLVAGGVGAVLLDRGDLALRDAVAGLPGVAAEATDRIMLIAELLKISFLVLFLVLLGGSLAAVSLVGWLALRTARAIERTARLMTRLAEGEFEIDLPPSGRSDEIG